MGYFQPLVLGALHWVFPAQLCSDSARLNGITALVVKFFQESFIMTQLSAETSSIPRRRPNAPKVFTVLNEKAVYSCKGKRDCAICSTDPDPHKSNMTE